ncbi:membrane protein [Capnocytophaga canis]|nr:membrane protein [Capnocytophaga canis]
MLPAIVNSVGIISSKDSNLYFVSSRYLLPAALILMTLSVDLKSVFRLGSKALVMFFAGTIGVVIGGPIAILIVSLIMPEAVGGAGFDAVWRGLSTLAGSWIGGGANQAAMLEIYQYNPEKYGAMVLVDIVVANIWMAFLLFFIARSQKIDKWLKADNSSIEELKQKVITFSEKTKKIPMLTDYKIMLGITFGGVGLSHFGADFLTDFLKNKFYVIGDKTSALSFFGDKFFWMITFATLIGLALSFTKAKNYEGAGASKLGSVFIYILVATIGMKMDLTKIFDNLGLLLVGIIWMAVHVGLMFIVAKIIRAPLFFLAVGSKANIGGAASAPVVASAFHPSLATVGVLLAVLGYIVGTYAAMLSAFLMEYVSVTQGVMS